MEQITLAEYDESRPTTGRNAHAPKYDWDTILGATLDDDGNAVAAVRLHRSTYHTATDGARTRLQAKDFDVKPATMLKAARDAITAAGLTRTLAACLDRHNHDNIVIGPRRERPADDNQDETTPEA